jgi:uncharacterized protein
MGKLLSWVVLFALGWLAYKFVVVSARKRDAARARGTDGEGGTAGGAASGGSAGGGQGGGAQPDPARIEQMVPCAHCGVYLPASDALQRDGQAFCSAAHRDAGAR